MTAVPVTGPRRDRHPVGWFMVGLLFTLAAAGFVGVLVTWPVLGGWLLSLVVVGLGCWWLPTRALREELRGARLLHAAWDGGAVRDDLAEVGSVTPPRGVVELFDGARLAEMRDDHVCTYECAGAGCDDPVPDRPCYACGKPAVFAWETDGFPFAACNLCVELWFPDGLPDHVERLFDGDQKVCVWCHQPVHDGECKRDDLPDYVTPEYVAEVNRIKAGQGEVRAAGYGMHVSRGWNEDPYAPHCGCPLAGCGLVLPQAGCVQHDNQKTIRNAHMADECPALTGAPKPGGRR